MIEAAACAATLNSAVKTQLPVVIDIRGNILQVVAQQQGEFADLSPDAQVKTLHVTQQLQNISLLCSWEFAAARNTLLSKVCVVLQWKGECRRCHFG